MNSWKASNDGGNRAVDKSLNTPEALRKMYRLLDADGVPLYSARAIARCLSQSILQSQ
jgi:hypothetical protein